MGTAAMQGELWGAAPRDWADIQEPTGKPLWESMLKAAGVAKGKRFLDAGCGAGGASMIAAHKGSRVKGIDASSALISLAKERIPEGDFRVGDLEHLPYENDAFNAIIAANSVEYADDPVAALQELRRVCTPGGRVVVAVWGKPEHCEQRDIFKAVAETLPSPPPGGGPFALSEPGALESLVERAGLTAVGSSEVDCPFEYKDLDTAYRAQRSAGPLQGAMRAIGEERIKAAVLKAHEPHQTREGKVRLANRFRYVTAVP